MKATNFGKEGAIEGFDMCIYEQFQSISQGPLGI